MESDATDKILDAVAAVDKKIDDSNKANDERFGRLERDAADTRKTVADHGEMLSSHAKLHTDHATFLGNVQTAAARAIDIALDAKREASRSVDEATKIVESAIRMHSASIAATVQSAVKSELGPLTSKVGTIEQSDEAQTKAIEEQTESIAKMTMMLTGVVRSLGHPVLRVIILGCAMIGAIGGGFYAGYLAKQGTDAVASAPSRPEPTTTRISPTPLKVEVMSSPDASFDASH